MLRHLHISNLAVIEDASLDLGEGLNVFTGQTGAGKSLIIGAFELLLALRSGGGQSASMIRNGCDEAVVTGLFELHDPRIISRVEEILGCELEEGQLQITRKLFSTGRSSVTIDGRAASAGILKAIGQFLVDIHGQHDQQYLLKPSNQQEILDDFAGCGELRHEFARKFANLRELRHQREDLEQSAMLRKNQLELLEFQAAEIDEVDPQPGEYEQTRSLYEKLSNITTLKSQAAQISLALCENENSPADQLQAMIKPMESIARLDEEKLRPIAQLLADATELARDVSYQLDNYAESLDIEPGQLEETQQRLDDLNNIIHKYGPGKAATDGDPIDVVLEFREKIAADIESLNQQTLQFDNIDAEIESLTAALAEIGCKLTAARSKAAGKLSPMIEAQLDELGMAEARFTIDIHTCEITSDNASASGLDRIEFMVQTNPGLSFQPLRQIASGGETSRIMLAIKSILAASDTVSVLVFDEIDANIGGRLGAVVGRKMRQLAHSAGHQVLCITHLPQLAAFGDNHLHIAKQTDGLATTTTVLPLTGNDREHELAAMLAGEENITDASYTQAQQMLQTAE